MQWLRLVIWTSACNDVIFALLICKDVSGWWDMQPKWCLRVVEKLKKRVIVYGMLSFFTPQFLIKPGGLLFPTRGWFQCVLGQCYIGLWAFWDNYIWEERHTTHILLTMWAWLNWSSFNFFVFLLCFKCVPLRLLTGATSKLMTGPHLHTCRLRFLF